MPAMPSVGHVLVGMAVGRAYLPRGSTRAQLAKSMAAFSALSMLPDADVIAFSFGIPYSHVLGHRGWTHSIGFSIIAAAIAWLLAPRLGQPRARLALFALATAFSHGLLDTFTNGGLGCAIFWPITAARFFFPPHIIPVAPIGLGMLSLRGFLTIAVELVMFFPFFLYATFPRKAAARS